MSRAHLRLVFVNCAPPDAAHVSGQRFSNFARVLSAAGHHVVLLTSTPHHHQLRACEANALLSHDWKHPFHAAIPLASPSNGRLPLLMRKARTALRLMGEGHLPQWTQAAQAVLPALSRTFQPHAVWGCFGFVSDLVIAQRLARLSHCPWALDFKDSFDAFIPAPMRALVARRFADASGATANAAYHAGIAHMHFPALIPEIIYSGVADSIAAVAPRPSDHQRFVIALIGGLYEHTPGAQAFFAHLQTWLAERRPAESERIELVYAGSDHQRAEALTAGLTCPRRIHAYLPLADLAEILQRASFNAYIWSDRTFHHKVLELLASGRPTLAWGGERAEALSFAQKLSADFTVCCDRAALHRELDRHWQSWRAGTVVRAPIDAAALSWETFGALLERFFVDLAERQTELQRPALAAPRP